MSVILICNDGLELTGVDSIFHQSEIKVDTEQKGMYVIIKLEDLHNCVLGENEVYFNSKNSQGEHWIELSNTVWEALVIENPAPRKPAPTNWRAMNKVHLLFREAEIGELLHEQLRGQPSIWRDTIQVQLLHHTMHFIAKQEQMFTTLHKHCFGLQLSRTAHRIYFPRQQALLTMAEVWKPN